MPYGITGIYIRVTLYINDKDVTLQETADWVFGLV